MLSPSVDTFRLYIHVLSASIWVGGQFVLAGIVPGLRKVGPEATSAAANGFARIAWPAFAIAFMTGIWSLLEVGTDLPDGYNVTLGIKLLLVVAAGGSAAAHSWSSSKLVKGVTGALGGLMGIVIMFLGSLLAHSA